MRIPDRHYPALKRLQILTGVVPVGLFLATHFAINGRAIAGREAYAATVAAIARIPWLAAAEVVLIGLPLVAHLTLGVLLGMSRRAAFEPAHPNSMARWIQRGSGFYLAMYVVSHVWALRFAPDRLAGKRELFDMVAGQLAHPAVFALHALAVIAAGAHFAVGCMALFGPHAFTPSAGAERTVRISAIGVAVAMTALGLNALLAFVWSPAQWLAAK
jgi:succinate dehydrogenase / fumarate reductase cytochrome b subunit